MVRRIEFWRGILIAACLIMLTPALAIACSCMFSPNTCSIDWKKGELVFLGKVTTKEPIRDADGAQSFPTRVAVHFSVTETLRGAINSDKETVIFTGAGGGDCGYPFIVGQTYLVYASTYQDQLTTSICTQTRPVGMAAALIRQLRAKRKSSDQPTLFGMIGTAAKGVGYEELVESKGLARVRVRAIGSAGPDHSTTSDTEGVYAFDWLPADTYRLEIDLPQGLSTWQHNTGKPFVVHVGNTEESRGCSLDVFARPDGRVSGTIVDLAGKNVAGFITIKPSDPIEAEAASRRGGLPGFTSQDGKFTLWQIPPGTYRLVFYPIVNGQVNLRSGFGSKPIEIAFGEQIENYRFTVPINPPQ
ncbi:MAG TPA: hypothetical protein VFX97_18185 [Pyrinomonadaceae bacterium]|nr:hypothetical protein [Pyrinomonadaceae bacterium]